MKTLYSFLIFIITVGIILVVARKNLGISLLLGAVFLGVIAPYVFMILDSRVFTTLSPYIGSIEIVKAFTTPSNIILAFTVSLVPLIGGTMENTGQVDQLVTNIRLPTRAKISFLPALVAMLPLPGGALLSSPIVEEIGGQLQDSKKVAINIWFRHIFFLVYPLSPTLLISAEIAGLDVYRIIPWLFPFFLASIIVGYMFLLRDVKSTKKTNPNEFSSLKKVVTPILIFILPLLIDLFLRRVCPFFRGPPFNKVTLLVGVIASFLLSLYLGEMGFEEIKGVWQNMHPWNYALIIFSMFAFLNVFIASPLPTAMSALHITPQVLFVVVSFFLAFCTGRTQATLGILLPIILSSYHSISLLGFAFVYSCVFIGHLFSPLHPCVSVSLEYFDTSLGKLVHDLALPTFIIFVGAFFASYIFPLL